MKKPFKQRIKDLLVTFKENEEAPLSVLLEKLPEIEKNSKKFAMVQGLLRTINVEIVDDVSEEESDDLDTVEFNEKEAVAAEQELKEQMEKENKEREAAAAASGFGGVLLLLQLLLLARRMRRRLLRRLRLRRGRMLRRLRRRRRLWKRPKLL